MLTGMDGERLKHLLEFQLHGGMFNELRPCADNGDDLFHVVVGYFKAPERPARVAGYMFPLKPGRPQR